MEGSMVNMVPVWRALQSEQCAGAHYFSHYTLVNFVIAEVICIKFPSSPESVPSLALKMTRL